MKKIVAILTQNGALSKGLSRDTIVNLFKLDNEKVTGVENVYLEDTAHDYFSLLMRLKNVSMVYVDSVSHDLEYLLNKMGIITRGKDEVDGDNFIEQFIFN